MSGAMMLETLHSEIVEAPLTDRELGDLASCFGAAAAPPRCALFVGACVRGSTISLIWHEATMG